MFKKEKTALVCGAGGFIGSHLVKRLSRDNYWVRGVDIKEPEFSKSTADEFIIGDLREKDFVNRVFDRKFNEVYQLAANMGGAGYIFTGEHDAEIISDSAIINLNVLNALKLRGAGEVFYSSSACVYPSYNQKDPENPVCSEDSAYPADPDSEYGWEKLFSEHLYLSYQKNYHLKVRIARFHNVYGPEGTWRGGREKVPAATCRKVAEASNPGRIEMWGDGRQTRSFLYIEDCLDGMRKLMDTPNFSGPVNIGSEEMVSINRLANIIINIAAKEITIDHTEGPTGVRGRNSDNRLAREKLNWEPRISLTQGLIPTYNWINKQVAKLKDRGI